MAFKRPLFFFFPLILFIYLFLERGKEGKKHQRVVASHTHPHLGTWPATQACALDWESNWQTFGSQAGTESIEPYQPRLRAHS